MVKDGLLLLGREPIVVLRVLGLGMTMVYKIIKEFSGDIQVKSEQGKGTSFVLSIPVPQTDRKLIES